MSHSYFLVLSREERLTAATGVGEKACGADVFLIRERVSRPEACFSTVGIGVVAV